MSFNSHTAQCVYPSSFQLVSPYCINLSGISHENPCKSRVLSFCPYPNLTQTIPNYADSVVRLLMKACILLALSRRMVGVTCP